jgi:hypothetical protein
MTYELKRDLSGHPESSPGDGHLSQAVRADLGKLKPEQRDKILRPANADRSSGNPWDPWNR